MIPNFYALYQDFNAVPNNLHVDVAGSEDEMWPVTDEGVAIHSFQQLHNTCHFCQQGRVPFSNPSLIHNQVLGERMFSIPHKQSARPDLVPLLLQFIFSEGLFLKV